MSNAQTKQALKARRGISDRALPYVLVAPTFLFIVMWLILPLGYALYCSFWRCDYLQFTKTVGLENYISMLGSKAIQQDIGRTFYISGLSLAIALVLGTVLALWINSERGMLAYLIQLMGLIPWVTSMVVAAMLWKWILQDDSGLMNYFIRVLGGQKVGFLTNKTIAVYALIFVMTWRVIGYVMVQVLAGLKSVPHDLEEAAYVDGANKWQMFWAVRFPMLKTPLTISAIIVGLSNLNNLTVPLTLTGGGPGVATTTIAIELNKQSMKYYHFGEASALSVVLVAINFILMLLYVKAVKYDV